MIGTKQPLTYRRKQRLQYASVMNPDLARSLLACLIGAPYLDASRLSSTSKIASQLEISTRRERGTDQMLIPQGLPGLVQLTRAAAFWNRLISAFFFFVVDQEVLSLESLPFEPDKTTSDSSRPKRRRMYSIPLEFEEMEDMESTTKRGFAVQNVHKGSNSGGSFCTSHENKRTWEH